MRRPASALYWPGASHVQLLRLFGRDRRSARHAWAGWLRRESLDAVEPDVFQLLPSFFLAARDELEPGIAAKLRGIYRFAWLHAQLARRELTKVAARLDGEGIRPIVLDGPALALFHYPDPGARPAWNLEFLLHDDELPAAARALAGTGWVPAEAAGGLDRRPFRPLVSYRLQPPLSLSFTSRPFLTSSPRAAEDAFRARAVSRALDGAAVRVPDPTDLLLAACVRGRLAGLQDACLWAADALVLLQSASIDWPGLVERVKAGGVLLPVRDALAFLNAELDAGVPGEVLAALWDADASSTDESAYRDLLEWNRPRFGFLARPLGGRRARRVSAAKYVCYFGHHRSASTYTHHVIQAVCRELGWPFWISHAACLPAERMTRHGTGPSRRFLIYTNAEVHLPQALPDCLGFHLVRDPRDIVVSSYFSHRYSHPTGDWPELARHRRELEALTEDEGLLHEIVACRREQFAAMYEWDYARPNVLELRMEDLVRSPAETFLHIFRFLDMLDEDATGPRRFRLHVVGAVNRVIGRVGNAASQRLRHRPLVRPHGKPLRGILPERLRAIVDRHAFVRKTGGRAVGHEDVRSHYRKGSAGDWRQHFKPQHVDAFKARYNDLLVKLGYESDDRW